MAKGDYSIKFVEGKDGELVLAKGKKEVAKVDSAKNDSVFAAGPSVWTRGV